MSVTDSKMENQQQQQHHHQQQRSTSGDLATTNAANPSVDARDETAKDDVKMNGESIGVKENDAKASLEMPKDSVTNGHAHPVSSNGHTATGTTETPPIQTESSALGEVVVDGEEEEEEETRSVKSEGADEEDALFTNLEQEEEKEEAAHPHEQPKDKKAAPKLLQSALAMGDVKMDDSEHGAAPSDSGTKTEDVGDETIEEEHHLHQRVRNKYLYFVLVVLCDHLSATPTRCLPLVVFVDPCITRFKIIAISTGFFAIQSVRVFKFHLEGFGRIARGHDRNSTSKGRKGRKTRQKAQEFGYQGTECQEEESQGK
jgi:hypothetical protein